MQWLSQWLVEHLLLGVLVMTRLSALLLAMPTIGSAIPKRVRVILAVLMTSLVLPSVAAQPTVQTPAIENLIDLLIAVGREALIGLLIGATIQLIITGIQLSGEIISGSGGMQLGQSTDSATGEQIPTMARLVGLLVVAVMLAAGGHRLILNVLLDSFRELPPGQVVIGQPMLDLVIDQLTAGMIAGIQVAAPVVAALLLTNLITGLISRTLPQINVLAIGLSVNSLALLIVTALTIGSAGLIFQNELGRAAERLTQMW